MAMQAIELILARQLAGCLAVPCYVFDATGTLVFYNEPAEAILGQRFDETGAMRLSELSRVFSTTNAQGIPIPADSLPLQLASVTRRPITKRFWIRGLDGVRHHIASCAFPLIGEDGELLGVMSTFPEVHDKLPVTFDFTPEAAGWRSSETEAAAKPEQMGPKPQKEIEIILTRHLASYLAIPIAIFDPLGTVFYYNPAGEAIAGKPFEEAGEMPVHVWTSLTRPTDRSGRRLPLRRLPLIIALTQHQPAQSRLWIHGLDGVQRQIDHVAFPIIGQAGQLLGAMALFWEVDH